MHYNTIFYFGCKTRVSPLWKVLKNLNESYEILLSFQNNPRNYILIKMDLHFGIVLEGKNSVLLLKNTKYASFRKKE